MFGEGLHSLQELVEESQIVLGVENEIFFAEDEGTEPPNVGEKFLKLYSSYNDVFEGEFKSEVQRGYSGFIG